MPAPETQVLAPLSSKNAGKYVESITTIIALETMIKIMGSITFRIFVQSLGVLFCVFLASEQVSTSFKPRQMKPEETAPTRTRMGSPESPTRSYTVTSTNVPKA